MKTQVPPTGTLETSGAGPPPAGVCEHSDASGAGAGEEVEEEEEEEFAASVAAAAAAAAALSLLATSVTENVCCCCCCWAASLLLLLLLLLAAAFLLLTTHVNVGAPSTTALVPAGLAFLSADPPSIATASESLRPSEAMAGGPDRTGPILAASGSFSAAACGVGVSVKANVVALGGPEAEYSMVPARLSVEVQGLLLALARVARARRSRSRSRC